jgi:hypothetical protein
MTQPLRRALDAISRGETPPQTEGSDARLVEVAAQLATAARAIEPPAGAFGRAVAAAVHVQPRRTWTRRALAPALALPVLVAAGLGSAAYASTPGDPLYPVQRELDELYLGLPRSPADAAEAYRATADRRLRQAAVTALPVGHAVLRDVLVDAARYLREARAAAEHSSASDRSQLFRALLGTQRTAKDRLAAVAVRADEGQEQQFGQLEEMIQQDIDDEERELEEGAGPRDRTPGRPAVPDKTDEGPAGGDVGGRGAAAGAGRSDHTGMAPVAGQTGGGGSPGPTPSGGSTGSGAGPGIPDDANELGGEGSGQ